MLKRIRIFLDYGCYPVWLYDENGDVIDTLLPEELHDDAELEFFQEGKVLQKDR